MWLEKDGIRVEHENPADIARMKTLGYKPVEKAAKVEPPPAIEAEAEPTPEQQNATAIEAVNTSVGTPKATKGGGK